MSDAPAKLKRLEEAGILEQRLFTPEELALVGTITDEEVEVLISLKHKMGARADAKCHIRPNFAV
jgi:hypothetical protein